MKLVIVESPTKAKTIGRFVGDDFVVTSSYGHVRDLPTSTLGVDVENEFQPKYIVPRKSQKNVTALKKAAKKADEVILATDEDREGEAIAWHLAEVLKLTEPKRIVFHEITKHAIEEALEHPRSINGKLVEAQQARRILDRLVGYTLSPFLWKKVMRGLSAGRVQSVALRLIVERERERKAFIPVEYWSIGAELKGKGSAESFVAFLHARQGKVLDKLDIKGKDAADAIVKELESTKWQVASITKKAITKSPLAPFTTSTLQQDASRRFGFSARQTMFIAQQLYEGVELKEGSTGLITYMRTDSVNLAPEAVRAAAQHIRTVYGEQYTVPDGRVFKTKSKGAQEAHEAIRPADVALAPQMLKEYLEPKQFKLYDIVWRRFVASQMQPAQFDATTVDIATGEMIFRASGQIMKFDGHYRVWPVDSKDIILPPLKEGDELTLNRLLPEQHFTQPPARYSEATLIKALEEHGIGRPSTYAPTMATLDDRGYVTKDDKKKLAPTEVGEIVNDLIVVNFPQIVDLKFTAHMEEELDKIATGETPWIPIISEFYGPFAKLLEEKIETVEKRNMTEETDEICEKCGKPMVIKHGRFGKFVACSGFPECRNTKTLPPKSLGVPCPECKEGEIVERMTKKRRMFYGCSRYPTCTYATWKRPGIEGEDGPITTPKKRRVRAKAAAKTEE